MRCALWILVLLSGCQCCGLTECYQDDVDVIADHECHWDRWYRPGLDLTRIGHRDWCQNRFNRWLCPCNCERPTILPCEHQVVMAPATATPPNAPPVEPPPRPMEPQPFSPPETDSYPIPTLPEPLPVPARTVEPAAFEIGAVDLLVPPDNIAIPAASVVDAGPADAHRATEEASDLLPWMIKQSAANTPAQKKPLVRAKNGRVIAPRPDDSALPEWARSAAQ